MGVQNGRWTTLCICVVGLLCGLVLAACSQSKILSKMSLPEDRALSQTVIRDIEAGAGGDAELQSLIEPSLRPKLPAALAQIRSALPRGTGRQVRLVDASFTVTDLNGQRRRLSYLGYELDAGGKHALVRIQILRQDAKAQITSLYLNTLPASAEQLGGFSLSGKSPPQYIILALTGLSLVTILLSEVVLVMTGRIRLKWLWFLGCLFGYSQISIDWSTGAMDFMPLNIQLLGAFALKAGVLAPWRVGFGIPVVSIIFLIMRRRLQKPVPQPAAAFS